MAKAVVTISNPAYNRSGGARGISATVPCAEIDIDQEFGTVSQATLSILSNIVALYRSNINPDLNPLMPNSKVLIRIDGALKFKGVVLNKPVRLADAGNTMQVICHGVEGALLQTSCNYTSENSWIIETSYVQVVDLPLKACSDYGTFDGDTLWADPADATGAKCYIQDADCPQDDLTANLNIGETTLVLGTSNKGLESRGWIKIGTEWMYYDGYDNANVDTKFRCYNLVRGLLGTTEANHVITDTAYNKISKTIAPQPLELQQDPGSGYKRLKYGSEYSIVASLGCFVLPGTASGTYKATLYFYDEDATLDPVTPSTIYYVEDVVDRIARADKNYGGAGFASGDCLFDSTGYVITRYEYDPEDKPKEAWQAIQDFLDSINLGLNLKFWYSHRDEKLRFASIANGVSPLCVLQGCYEIEEDCSLEEVFSAVRVAYTDDQVINRASKERSYHQAATGVGTSPDAYYLVEKDGSGYITPSTATLITAAGNDGMEATTDGNVDSKLVGDFTHNPAGSFVFGDWWFKDPAGGTVPDQINLKRVKLKCNTYRVIEDWGRSYTDMENMYVVRLLGCTDYDTSTNDSTSGIWTCLAEIRGTPNAYGGAFDTEITKFPIPKVNCLRVVFDYMAGVKISGEYYTGAVHDLIVEGDLVKYAYVQTSDTIADNSLYVKVDQETQDILRGGVNANGSDGSPRVYEHNIGTNSPTGAVSLARLLLQAKLLQYQQRTFVYPGDLTTMLEPGDYIGICTDGDGIAEMVGVIQGLKTNIRHDKLQTTIRLMDWDVPRIGK